MSEESGGQKVILVTGGTGALGSAIVKLCAASTQSPGRCNQEVVANYFHDEPRALALRVETRCGLWRADVRSEEDVEAMCHSLPNLWAIVHAAGQANDALLARQSRGAWDGVLASHAQSAFLIARAGLKHLPRGGRMVFLASRVGERGGVGQAAYAASKAAVLGLVKSAAREGAANGIAVNAVCPGYVLSEMNRDADDARLEKARRQSLRGELADAQTTASLVCWLLGETGSAVSGQVLHCDDRM